MSIFSTRIKELRSEAKISQQELSKIIGISKSSINMYERGEREPGLNTVKAFADYFNVNTDYLLGKSNKKSQGFTIRTRLDQALAQNFKSHREEAGISTKEMANLLDVNEEIISKIESSEYKLSKDMIFKTCDILNITPDILDGMISERLESGDLDAEYCYTRLTNHLRTPIRPIARKKLPMLGNIACGEPIFATEEHDTYIDVDSDIAADFCLTAKGDSMVNARIFDGDILFVKKQDTVDDGEIAVVLIEDEATVKRVYYDKENNILTLMPENPTHKPMRYEGEKLNQIRILGKIVFGQYNME